MNLALAAALCRRFEQFYSKPYLCPAGIPTIGYGTTFYPDGKPVTLNDPPITKAQAEVFLQIELERCAASVARMCPVLVNYERRFNAVVDFVYNLGAGRLQTSTLRRKINAEDWPAAVVEIKRWCRAGGRVLRGLVLRREADALLLA